MVGCGKKTSVTGKVVDGKGKPLAGVKIQALQEQPLKGYEQFDCTSGVDGNFKFSKLYPTSSYVLVIHLDDTLNKNGLPINFISKNIISGPEGETMILPEPITIQKTSLEGKVVDGKGKPLAGVNLNAVQLKPRDTDNGIAMSTSGADGNFKFTTLFPNATFELIPSGAIESRIEVVSGAEGQTKSLPEPIIIRIQFSKDGATALDTKTGLMWAKNGIIADRRMKWDEAMSWVKKLDIGGHRDWRLPSKAELIEFGKDYAIANFENNQLLLDWFWSSTESSNNKAWAVSWVSSSGSSRDYESNKRDPHFVWPVRSGH
jgi:hypothetical protein